ncbi:DMT family transporter [Brasilonema sp. UFV-L1]|uniref:DMT family transporter n=1 Tax=Brasilonema sp. UFV-L1 TaxID=2234130 RepID=UPI00145DDD63|nr:DMT family transporter [Brasilonema sp. UFV-L1]NMG07435.1 EamA/RhaT family transporter [Brasilonema sp. UFV-L1]
MTAKLELPQQQLSKTSTFIGTASLFVALIPISLAPVLVKLCEREISANAVVFHRAWIATIVFGLWCGLQTLLRQKSDEQPIEQKPLTRGELALLVAMGTAGATYLLLWAWSLTQTSVANVALLSNLNPLFVGLAGYLLFGRRFDNRFVIGMIMAVGGAIAIELNKVQFATDQILGDALALLTAIFIAAYLMLVERLRRRFSTATIMLWRCGVTTVFLLPVLPSVEDRLLPYTWMGWFFVIFQALLCQVFGQGLLAYSLSKLSSGVVAVTLLLEPVLASFFAWVIFNEKVSFSDWVAFVVVLFGIYLAQSSQSAVKATN